MSLLPANSARRKRLALVLFLVFGVGTAVVLAMKALQQNINVYYSPSEVAAGKAPKDRTFRLGGMVVAGSIMAQGRFNRNGVFVASEVLAKHDEKYVPPEVERAIKKAKGQQPAGNK